ncbi:phosphate/phosphite/phosphonate ABC transporter substrate-binding protein [Bdellovibrio svalbardensis]|uniref:Phosphate/phosphite/phosphonate ABC transporter substrate-binding protein n=1 Tax=Bdellovibrio svalbardensis TaxID=2972972 RepID=A0ABT6DFK3_9BACT|nr:phosphate/phosphite/phosphonate ABC transporter substrate-binding protein [Bdellovibrio svalbardensis]MDG0815620.1 phosphate/phosphite/phosphonate ABC transporter substrate-binding protein [Bdellovibrio svalbardensis]
MMKKMIAVLSLLCATGLAGCHFRKEVLGSAENPIKFHLVPSVDAKVLADNSKILKEYLEKNTPYKFQITIPQSFVAVVESFGTERADVAAINTYGYYMAHKAYGVEARLTVIRYGLATYQSQFLARSDSKIKTLKDLQGKKMAFVDPASMSGYLLPLKTLNDKKITLKQTVFAMNHDAVVTMIYQGQVDAGATYYSPPQDGHIEDARRLVKTQYPDVEQKVKIIELSEPIPNDPIVFRKDLPEEMKEKISDALLQFVATPEGKKSMDLMLGATNLKKSTDADYDTVREMLRTMVPEKK